MPVTLEVEIRSKQIKPQKNFRKDMNEKGN